MDAAGSLAPAAMPSATSSPWVTSCVGNRRHEEGRVAILHTTCFKFGIMVHVHSLGTPAGTNPMHAHDQLSDQLSDQFPLCPETSRAASHLEIQAQHVTERENP